MKTAPILIISLSFLASTLAAQTVIATPFGKGFETKDGGDQLATGWNIGYASNFFRYAQGRYQYLDGELQGTLRVIKSIGFRMDYKNHTASSGLGRTWSNVDLYVSELPFSSFTSTFASNSISPVKVFSGAVNWPDVTGNPTTNPAPLSPALQFPFSPSAWLYTGNQAILQDYQLSGGTLSSGTTWSGNTSNTNYHLDGAIIVTSMSTGASSFPSGSTCHDPAVTATQAAQMVTQYVQYSKAYTPASKADMVDVPVQSRYTAPNALVAHGLGIGAIGNGVGVPIGALCHNLILDTSKLHVILLTTAGALPNADSVKYTLSYPRTPANLGLEVWMQGAWSDSVTNAFSLTTASRAKAPTISTGLYLGMTEVLPLKKVLYTSSTSATTGSIAGDYDWPSYPLTFFTM